VRKLWTARTEQRVECLLDSSQTQRLKHKLCSIMDQDKDSLRLYYLGNNYETRIEHFGVKEGYDPQGALMV
jgi:CRISPR-associated protein Cas2